MITSVKVYKPTIASSREINFSQTSIVHKCKIKYYLKWPTKTSARRVNVRKLSRSICASWALSKKELELPMTRASACSRKVSHNNSIALLRCSYIRVRRETLCILSLGSKSSHTRKTMFHIWVSWINHKSDSRSYWLRQRNSKKTQVWIISVMHSSSKNRHNRAWSKNSLKSLNKGP